MNSRLCDIAWNLRRTREARNLTQEYIAAQLDISTTAYRNIENRCSQVSLKRLFEIADILNVSVAELLELPPPGPVTCPHCHSLLPTRSTHGHTDKAEFLLIEQKRLDEITKQLADLMQRLPMPNERRKR